MIDATLLMEGTEVFSPWFPRRADMLRVTAECIAVNGTTLTIELYTKNSEDPGEGDPVDENVSITLTAPGRSTAEWKTVVNEEGVEELLRFKLTVGIGGEYSNDWILYRLLPPVWFDAVTG